MTAYLDESNPNSRSPNYRVQSDPQELKYNNIQSCIAVAMYPSATNQLVGVHLTTATTGNFRLAPCSKASATFSPTTVPIDPPMNPKSRTTRTEGLPPIAQVPVTTASVSPVRRWSEKILRL